MTTSSLLLSAAEARVLRDQLDDLPSIALHAHELAALELLMLGALAPLDGFNVQAESTLPMLPLVISEPGLGQGPTRIVGLDLDIGAQLALQDTEGVTLAVLAVQQLKRNVGAVSVGGPVRCLQMPVRELFVQFQMSAEALRNSLSLADKEQLLCVHVRGDIDTEYAAWVKACSAKSPVLLRILDGGDPDHAHKVKRRLTSALALREQLGAVRCVIVVSPDPCPAPGHTQQALDECFAANSGCASSVWLGNTRKAEQIVREGTCIFFTGLSGAGKSTLARSLHAHLVHSTERAVTLLDGDAVRQHLSKGLGFSRVDRDLNVQRIGYVASHIVMHGGLVICAPIAPYAKTRDAVRAMTERHGRFVEVHVSTTLAVCEARDRKGLYAKARAGQIKEFTGISDPYEVPANAELTIDTDVISVNEAVMQIANAITT
ncbi:MAG: sulfate adenylyltransferase [Gammaproteobacteria bacterium]|jgi:sulfate adenylyltransferase